MSSLTALHADLTERLILDSAIAVLEDDAFNGLTVRAVAKRAGIAERTIFRYFASRDEFLDAIGRDITRLLQMPPAPKTTSASALKTYQGSPSQPPPNMWAMNGHCGETA